MRILVYGATSRIAQECARLWAARGDDLILCGRDAARLQAVADDLGARGARATVMVVPAAEDPALRAALDDALARCGLLDIALVAHGWLPLQQLAQNDPDVLRQALDVNAVSVAQVCESLAASFERQGRGTIAVIGSVAGDRGRQSNYIYGAAKGFVERYCQGLRNRLHPQGIRVTLLKPGPTRTPMTSGPLFEGSGARLADPDAVARVIVQAIDRGLAVAYAPGRWRWIMAAVRAIPEAIFVNLKL